MSYLSAMDDDEIRYICSVIPFHYSIEYFKRNPKGFAKIMPGFRTTSLKSQEQVANVLYRNRNHDFVSSYIEKTVSRWLNEIKDAINDEIASGCTRERAMLKTFPHCFFINNIGLYFKLTGEEYSEEFIVILSESINLIKEADTSRDKAKDEIKEKAEEINHYKDEYERIQQALDRANEKVNDSVRELKRLKHTYNDLEKKLELLHTLKQENGKLHSEAKEREKRIRETSTELTLTKSERQQLIEKQQEHIKDVENLGAELARLRNERQLLEERNKCEIEKRQIYEEYISDLEIELSITRTEQQHLEAKIREEIEKQQNYKNTETEIARKPKRPIDLEEFSEYLGYNLESLGVPSNEDCFYLLKNYLCSILFSGKPVIICKDTALSLMSCVSNALTGSPDVICLPYTQQVTEAEINSFLSIEKRIICLDNFIGNFNETILLELCSKHKDKIIFITYAYERTLCYVSQEMLKYGNYLNLNRIEALTGNQELTEDPSTVDEEEYSYVYNTQDSRWVSIAKKMSAELGVYRTLTASFMPRIEDEVGLCSMLAFSTLPFCFDVMYIAPFNTSEQLVKYAGGNGKCLYKDLLYRWFAR